MDKMQITSARYYQAAIDEKPSCIIANIDGVEMSVPIGDVGNRHYAEIMRQVEAGELTIADAN